MELYKEILLHALSQEPMSILFPQLQITAEQLIESVCYRALQRIKAIIEDDSLTDESCFLKIEEIINTLEDIGLYTGPRHDFG